MPEWEGRAADFLEQTFGMATHGEDGRLGRCAEQRIEDNESEQAFCTSGRAIGLWISRLMRVPGEGIPEHRLLLYSQAMERLPNGGRGRFAPGNVASRKSLTDGGNSRHLACHHEPLTGEGDSSDMATLVASRFSDQNLRRPNTQMRAQAFASRGGTIEHAVVALVALRPRIECVWAAVDSQKSQKAVEAGWGHSASCSLQPRRLYLHRHGSRTTMKP